MMPTAARRSTWAELLGHPDVVECSVRRSPVGLMAFHGGLEAGTAEIAEAVADAIDASLYSVQQPPTLRWHVPSRSVDPEQSTLLAEWLAHVEVAVAVHGYGRMKRRRQILLGGVNRALAARISSHLTRCLVGFEPITDLDEIPPELRGLHPGNPVNRPRFGGVQIELPPAARGTTPLPPDPAWGRGGAPARVVDALVAALQDYEAVCETGSEPAYEPD
jgi:phage replication-related protein YjqB (UPF0714/DUF867 family)